MTPLPTDILAYHERLAAEHRAIAETLAREIQLHLPQAEAKVWHGHPVWFIRQNPIVGYHLLKKGMRLLFWSGQSFDAVELQAEGSFKAAEIYFARVSDIDTVKLADWLHQGAKIQWDYKNIVKRKGKLELLSENQD